MCDFDVWEVLIGLALGAVLGLLVGLCIGEDRMHTMKRDAIRAGVAKFVVSDEGNTYFEWIKK